jgi:hypothetical protein
MREAEEYLGDTPSQEKSNEDITWIMNASYDASQTGDEPENKKCSSHSRTIEESTECPPRCSPEHRMTRRKWIIRKVIDERGQACHGFWTRSYRQSLVYNPINNESPHNMPEEIECNMFRPSIFYGDTIEPESDEEEAEQYWLTICDEKYEYAKPLSIYHKKIPDYFQKLHIEYLNGIKHRKI